VVQEPNRNKSIEKITSITFSLLRPENVYFQQIQLQNQGIDENFVIKPPAVGRTL
jgi:hypothetical protein